MTIRIYARRLGDKFSEGSRLLWIEMDRLAVNQADLTRQLGCAGGQVGRWLRGEKRPGGTDRGRLFESLGIAPQLWDQPPRKPFHLPDAAA